MEDYIYLEGREFVYEVGNEKFKTILKACDFDIGITAVDAENEDEYNICFYSPFTWKKKTGIDYTEEDIERYKKEYKIIMEEIGNGTFKVELVELKLKMLGTDCGEYPSAENCPYNM